ncbi:MAG TPA: MgtC/SapB family protein [Acidimicrobiia bacterium]|nr:MgtC/SapB family protein [Acidimicrobiia bacterium]
MDVIEFLARVGAGTALAAVLGIEREANRKAAGLRTYAMVGLGSAVFTIISMEAFDAADTSRVAAQIVSGIGFLGAGAIFRSGPLVKGLTTAAGLWAAAAIGMAAGTGNEMWALMASLLASTVFIALRWFDAAIARLRTGSVLEVDISPAAAFLTVRENLELIDPEFDLVDIHNRGDAATMRLIVSSERSEMLRHALSAMPDVSEARRVDR